MAGGAPRGHPQGLRDELGKALSLGKVLTQRWDLVEADFQHHYGLDLREEVEGPLRRLNALIAGLPPDSATWREDAWPPLLELIALQIERSDAWFRALLSALTGQKRYRVPGELQIERPGRAPDKQITTDPGDLAAWLRRRGGSSSR